MLLLLLLEIFINIFILEYTWGDPKIHGIVKNIYLMYLYKFETFVLFKILSLERDAAQQAPPQCRKKSKIFKGNVLKGRQRFPLKILDNVSRFHVRMTVHL